MKRALILAAVSVIAFNLWRVMPAGAWPFIAYAWAPVAIALAVQRLAPFPDEALSFLWLPAVAATAAALVGDVQMARLLFGPGLIALTAIAIARADDWPMRAFAIGIATEPLMWFAANAAPAIYGPEIATSRFAMAFGAWGGVTQWLLIMAAYSVAWYNLKGEKA